MSMVVHSDWWHAYRRLPGWVVEWFDHCGPGQQLDKFVPEHPRLHHTTLEECEPLRECESRELADADDTIQTARQEMFAAGIIGKIHSVVPAHFGLMWHELAERHFELDTIISLPLAGNSQWLTTYGETSELEDIVSGWEVTDADGDDNPYYTESLARVTGRSLRNVVKAAYIDLWWLAITEHRLRAVELKLASMLTPSFLGRLHQAIGK